MGSYDLSRFLEAQRAEYARALEELANGRKTTHWMWYIFPPELKRPALTSLTQALRADPEAI